MGNKKLTEEEVIKRINSTFLQDVELISPYINRRSLITLHCKDCEYVWNTSAQNVLYLKKGQKLHQCPNCSKSSYETDVKLNCSFCGKEIYRSPSQITLNKSGYFYCSRECGNKHKNLIRENSGEWDNSLNYRKRAFDFYPHKCAVCGWNKDERILEVHHKDSDRENNSVENLCILCPICHRKITLKYYILDCDKWILIKK